MGRKRKTNPLLSDDDDGDGTSALAPASSSSSSSSSSASASGPAAERLFVRALRGRTVVSEPAKPSKGYRRDTANVLYPSDIGPRSGKKRKGMNGQVTTDLLEAARNNSHASPLARMVEPLGGGKAELKSNNVSRNHILADSRIRNLLETVVDRLLKLDGTSDRTQEHNVAVREFFHAICGPTEGERLLGAFDGAYQRRDRFALNEVISEVCEGRRNLRLGLADANSSISNEFDPVTVNGALSAESARIADAVRGLAFRGLVPVAAALDSLAIAKDRVTHEDLSSTVLRSGRENQAQSRTVVDHFARPAAALTRRGSFSEGSASSSAFNWSAPAPAREYSASSALHTPHPFSSPPSIED